VNKTGHRVFSTSITNRLVIHTGEIEITVEDIERTWRGWYDHPDFKPDTPVLWDLRHVEINMTQAAIEELLEQLFELTNDKRSGRKSAWVLGTATATEFAVDSLSNQNWQNKVRIYQDDYAAAEAWLTSTIK
jgi:hypothetical protein